MSEYFFYRLLIKVPTQIRWPQYFKSPLLTVRSRLILPQISRFRYIVLKPFFFSVMSNAFKIIEVKNKLVFKESNCTVCVFWLESANLMGQLVFPVGSSLMQSPLLMLITLPFNYLWLPTGKTHSYVQCLLILILAKKYFSSFQPNIALIATLLRLCFEWLQHCPGIATLC